MTGQDQCGAPNNQLATIYILRGEVNKNGYRTAKTGLKGIGAQRLCLSASKDRKSLEKTQRLRSPRKTTTTEVE